MQLTRGVWQMSLAMIISGSIGAFVLLSGLPVTDVVFWRCLIGALTLLVFIVLSRQPFNRLTRFTLALAVIGGAALVVNWLLLFAAYSRISIGMATVVYNTQPFMLVLMGMVLGERVSAVKWGWLLLAFGGLVILLSSELMACTRRGAYHRRVAGAGRGILLCPDRHHRAQTASAPRATYRLHSGSRRRRDAAAAGACPRIDGQLPLALSADPRHRPYRDHVSAFI